MNYRRARWLRTCSPTRRGGVGKTTITLGVAAALAARGARVLLIDLDPQASATKVLGVETQDRCTMADVLLEPDRYPLSDAIARGAWGFDVAPAEMALASRESRRLTADEFVLRNQLDRVTAFDVVLVDCPPSLGVLTLNALAAASHLVQFERAIPAAKLVVIAGAGHVSNLERPQEFNEAVREFCRAHPPRSA
jgi:chromosome partitioning protein